MEHFYPYFDVVKTDWTAELPIALGAAAEDKDADAFGITLRKVVAALHDGHGNVTPGAAAINLPPILWTWADGRIVVLAASGVDGINPGDALVSIDGKPALEALGEIESLDSGATPQWVRYRALGELLARAPGASVRHLRWKPARRAGYAQSPHAAVRPAVSTGAGAAAGQSERTGTRHLLSRSEPHYGCRLRRCPPLAGQGEGHRF